MHDCLGSYSIGEYTLEMATSRDFCWDLVEAYEEYHGKHLERLTNNKQKNTDRISPQNKYVRRIVSVFVKKNTYLCLVRNEGMIHNNYQ